jgi:hypothetical protein
MARAASLASIGDQLSLLLAAHLTATLFLMML